MHDHPTRRRLHWTLFVAVGFMAIGYIAAVTVAAIAARRLTGDPTLAGLPTALAVIATATGTTVLGALASRRGRRVSLLVGIGIGAIGALVGVAGSAIGSLVILLAGMAALGFGNAASQLSRYTAAEIANPESRGTAVSVIVWASTIGAVVGPRLVGPMGERVAPLGWPDFTGGFMTAFGAFVLAGFVTLVALRPDPTSVAIIDVESESEQAAPTARFLEVLRRPAVIVAVVTMVIGHFVMVLLMTATPIHVEDHGFSLAVVGSILSAHTLGMFAFAPLVGRLVDRIGTTFVIVAGAGTVMVSAIMAAVADPTETTALTIALFLLGLGWNFGFVAGSTLLSTTVETRVRASIQGRVDTLIWGSSAVASLSSGFLLAAVGFRVLSAIGAVLVIAPVATLVANRPARTDGDRPLSRTR